MIMKKMAPVSLLACLMSIQSYAVDNVELSESIVSNWDSDVYSQLIVLTPTRIGQSIKDTPGTVTVLTRKDLLNRGITSIPEALRLIPGMSVIKATGFSQESGHDYEIAYHGGSARMPRRLQVQVDGMSVYLGGLSKIDWSQFPVTVQDIERIEVTRNPSSATYGANSFRAVINVITRHSSDVMAVESFLGGGTHDDHFALQRFSGALGQSTISFRASTLKDGGYDYGFTTRKMGDPLQGHRDTMKVDRLAVRVDSQIDDRTRVTTSLGNVSGDYEAEYVTDTQEPGTRPDITIDDWYLNMNLSRAHSAGAETRLQAYTKRSKLNQDFRACTVLALALPETHALGRANESYLNTLIAGQVPSGGTAQDDALLAALLTRLSVLGAQALEPICGTLNHDYVDVRHHLTLEHHWLVGEEIRFIGGATYEKLGTDSETFYNGKVSQGVLGVFFNSEWEPTEHVTYNAGFYVESSENMDSVNFNPRVSANWHMTDYATVRLVGTRGYRSPDIAETERDWSYSLRDIRPIINGIDQGIFAFHASSDKFDLKPEKIDAFELGIFVKNQRLPFTLDTRVFYEELSNLISEKPNFSEFNLSNNGDGIVQGVEFSFNSKLSDRVSVDWSYSYRDHDFETNLEHGLNPQHQGQAALIYDNSDRTLTAAYVGNSAMSRRSYDQWSITWLEKLKSGKTYIDVRTHLEYTPNDVGYAEDDIGFLNTFGYDRDIYLSLSAEISF